MKADHLLSSFTLLNGPKYRFQSGVMSGPGTPLLTTKDLFKLLNDKGAPSSLVKVYTPDGQCLPDSIYCAELCPLLINPLRLMRLHYSDQCSIVVNSIDLYSDGIEEFRLTLENKYNCLVEVNAYLTPANNQTFGWHSDGHQVLVIHQEGEKYWFVSEDTDKYEQCSKFILRPGDILEISEGFMHTAKASSSRSLHLTFSLYHPQPGRTVSRRLKKIDLLNRFHDFLEDDSKLENVRLLRNGPPMVGHQTGSKVIIHHRQFTVSTSLPEKIIDFLNREESISLSDLQLNFNESPEQLKQFLKDLLEAGIFYVEDRSLL